MPPLFEGLFPKVATTQSQLVDYLVKKKLVKTPAVEHVMRAVDRRHFVEPSTPKGEVYQDAPLPLGHGQTISAPHMHAIALELLSSKLVPEARALDVGSGSGYLTACMAQLVSPGGSVLGLEKVWQLVHRSRESIRSWHPELAASGALRIEHANALSEALEGCEACYHAIHVGAAAEELPKSLVDRLCPQGRMVVPVGPRGMAQNLLTVDKDASGQVRIEQQMGVAYVPLTHPGEDEWRNQG